MSERDEKRGGAGCAIGLVLVVLFLPILYVLGLGPAVWLAHRFPACTPAAAAIYYPLEMAHEHLGPVGELLDWYVAFWR